MGEPVSLATVNPSSLAFARVLGLLPDDYKHLLLLEALETCGPECLVGLEAARDSILEAAVRMEPALLRSMTSFLSGDDDVADDGVDDDDVPVEHAEAAMDADEEGGDDDSNRLFCGGDTSASSGPAMHIRASAMHAGALEFHDITVSDATS